MFFTKVGNQLYDIIGSAENNTVGNASSQIFATGYAEGGLVGDESATRLTDTDPLGVNSMIKQGAKSINKSFSDKGKDPNKAFREQMTNMHYIQSNFGQFFKGADTGGTNTAPKAPTQTKGVAEAVNPSEFYARWYESLRRFAEAQEVAQRGHQTVRSR